jgi:tetratricopeptide (TPR) repeat protein
LPALVAFALAISGFTTPVRADPLDDARELYRTGDYERALNLAHAGRTTRVYSEAWWRIEAECLLTLGRYEDAYALLDEAMRSLPAPVRLTLLAREAARYAQKGPAVDRRLEDAATAIVRSSRFNRSPEGLVAVGEVALGLGVEPRLVLENFFKPGREANPPVRDAFLAAGRLALAKHDDALASRTFQQGLAKFSDDPDMWAGIAAAFLDGDRAKLVEYAGQALKINPRHPGAHLLLAEHLIDSENYAEADAEIGRILEVNPRHPEALALRAVLAHLRNDDAAAEGFRAAALATWKAKPAVDFLIGRKLSQKNRFVEGAAEQRRALAFDPDYTPAKLQLAEDLLRLGREDEGWQLATEAHKADGYNVAAYNLVNLRDRLSSFTTLNDDHFRLRMGVLEAPVYGKRALALLEDARARLTEKYGVTLADPTTVEIYPNPKDFAVRTFGMPDNPGFLGVCFGPVVTVNSPATHRANWEAVLWHEFTHVITLTLTRNRMPRWLSEGISVYEEKQANPSWGQLMSRDYRDRIVDGRMQPISRMSAAFLQAKDGEDLQFAYFQSSLVVQFLVERYGFEKLRATLAALRDGADMNDALAQNVAPLEQLDPAFVEYATASAKTLGGDFDLAKPDNPIAANLAALNPRNFDARMQRAREAIEAEDWAGAKTQLDELAARGTYLPGEDNAQPLLARVCRELGDTAGEKSALVTIIEHEGDALDAVTRLLTIAEDAHDANEAARWANAWLAINPLAQTPWRSLLTANETLGHPREAAAAGDALLKLDPPDRPAVNYRIARQLQTIDPEAARLHVLLALEDAPRFRDAHALLATLPPGAGVALENLQPAGAKP